MSRHVLITGGAGYIGSMLVGALLRRGEWVTVADNLLFGGGSLLPYLADPAFRFLREDVCRPGLLDRVEQASQSSGAPPLSAIVHLAAIVGFPACQVADRDVVWKTNVDAVQRIFDEANTHGVERFTLASTYSVYGVAEDDKPVTEEAELRPQSLYAETKIAAESSLRQAAHQSDCAPLILRFATLYGVSPRTRFDLLVNQFVLEAFSQGELLIYEGDNSRSFVHIQDVITGLLMGLDAPIEKTRGQVFNLGHPDGNSTKDEIVALVCKALPNTQVRRKNMHLDGDMRDVRVSYEKIEKELGFSAQRDIPDGIDEVLFLLRSGLIADPYHPAYRNAPPIVA
ncbi:MAG: NAD-dependent epimerase/dehydratase family protein [Anaerolineales bacterium]|nr:NAD-dependent epimerase/dehydratase family protein [Anaerolineales bacterium]